MTKQNEEEKTPSHWDTCPKEHCIECGGCLEEGDKDSIHRECLNMLLGDREPDCRSCHDQGFWSFDCPDCGR